MIYTPENSPGSMTVDVEKGEYIYDVLAVDMDNATVTVIARPLAREHPLGIVTKKLRFRSVKVMPSVPGMKGSAKLLLCEGEIHPE